MKTLLFAAAMIVALAAGNAYGASGGLWEKMCAACHDGKTELNGKVVVDKATIKSRYRNVEELVNAVTCGTPPCMNILKHDQKLVRKVGKEIGVPALKQ